MKPRPRIWFLVSLLLFGGAAYVWRLGEIKRLAPATIPSRIVPAKLPSTVVTAPLTTNQAADKHKGPYRLSNTPQTLRQLARNEHGILLRNALIDTARPVHLDIPEHLRSHGAPGSYIAQSDRALNAEFMAALQRAGAQYVSYIPNNAALVKATPEAAQAMLQDPVFQAVLPYEPYYKLDTSLLPAAVEQQSATQTNLSVTTFPGQREAALQALENLGAKLIGEDRSPFGPTLVVSVPPGSLAAVAQLPQAQEIEPFSRRHVLNDLTRVIIGVAADTLIKTPNYMSLTGNNIWVNLNDTGVDATHPDFGPGPRLSGDPNDPFALIDNDGHGTHVAGIIMGNGTESTNITGIPPGSVKNADFRGKAPKASLFVQSLDLLSGPFISDSYLQTNASYYLRSNANATSSAITNGFISNNSWGYADTGYDMHSASFDQAVRDAEPEVMGEQAITYVFAAGNNDQAEDSINSPGAAKNVITVGATDSPRFITNLVSLDGTTTNELFYGDTDNNNSVASFSSAGNTDVGIEGQFGRYKPDVVAPGVFIISTRATNYVDPTTDETVAYGSFPQQVLNPNQTNIYQFDMPTNALAFIIQILPNAESPNPFPTNIGIWIDQNNPPTTFQGNNYVVVTNNLLAGPWYVGVVAPTNYFQPISYDMSSYIIESNYLGDYFQVLSNLNNPLKPYYRYESGTSMSAGAVSGMLALMQEFLTKQFPTLPNPSPALLKALLIQGSSSLNQFYDFNTQPIGPNLQGWGLVNIQNSLPKSMSVGATSLVYIDQSPTNALSTGQSQSYTVTMDTNATLYPLRVTLVWTDPPGNPAAGIALVNDLNLTVTDSTGTNVYIGNDFLAGDIFTEVNSETNQAAADIVNNVENVYIDTSVMSLIPPYTITVTANRVNVNAVTTQTNDIKQDYALVISSDDQAPATPLTVATNPLVTNTAPLITFATSGVPLLHQRVGANEPDVYNYVTGTTNGVTNQWHFFIFTNTVYVGTNTATNVLFATFLPPNLSIPRVGDADIDLYVSTNIGLLLLDPVVISSTNTQKSLNRGGNEFVIYTNSVPNEVYYIGVKSEDQQAADFGFYAVAQSTPFSSKSNGNLTANGTPIPIAIPDGSYDQPEGVMVLAPMQDLDPNPSAPFHIRKVTVDLGISHQNPGDLLGTLTYQGGGAAKGSLPLNPVVLNNHSGLASGFTNLYDSLPEDPKVLSVYPDGPGSLTNFVSQGAGGTWMLNEVDNALTHTGIVESLSIIAYPQPPSNNFTVTIAANGWYYDYIAVPNDATNLTIAATFVSGSGPVTIYLNPTNFPTLAQTYTDTNINAPGGQLSINTNSVPIPLRGGQWYYGLYNGSGASVTLNVTITITENLTPNLTQTFYNTNPIPLLTDGHTQSQICISNNQQLVSLNVGVRINDPNLDDLVLHLTSPQGTSLLLFENRGGLAATNLGLTLGTNTNNTYVYTVFTENTNLATTLIKFAPPPFAVTNGITTNVTVFTNSFETNAAGTYGLTNAEITSVLGANVEGWTVETNQVAVVTQDGSDLADVGSNYLALANGLISRTVTTTNQQSYQFTFAYRGDGLIDWWPADGKTDDIIGGHDGSKVTNITYVAGEVDQAWKFNGTNSEINFGTSVGNFGTNDFTIEYWINTVSTFSSVAFLEKRPACGVGDFFCLRVGGGSPPVPGTLVLEMDDGVGADDEGLVTTNKVNDGQWHHAAWTRRNGTNVSVYIDGKFNTNCAFHLININNNTAMIMGQSVCTTGPGATDGTQPFNGAADELAFYNRALTPAEIAAIYNAGSLGKQTPTSIYPNIQVVANNQTNTFIANPTNSWQTNVIAFTATNFGPSTITIQGNPLGMLLDNFTFIALPFTNYNNYFLPEESLTPFNAQNAIGCWTLDVWDTRLDAPADTSGMLLSWNMDMTFSSTNVNLIVLTNQVPYINTIPAGTNIYFAFDVPSDANYVTNTMTNITGVLSLLFNQTALPIGTQPGDYTLFTGTGVNSYTLTNNAPPPMLIPGQRYFLTVQNTTATAIPYSLEASADVSTNVPIIALTNGLSYTSTNVTANTPQYYSFDVPDGASLVAFEVLNPTDDVDLYVRHDLPLPTLTEYDYTTTYAGTNDETIVVTSNSIPVALTPGTWYAMVNASNNNNYVVRASFLTNVDPVASAVVLTNGLNPAGTNFTAQPGAATNFYSYTVTNNPAALKFIVTNLSGNVELLVEEGIVPTPQEFYEGSFNLGTNSEIVVIATNSSLLTLSNTTWYLGLPNNQTNATAFSIIVTNIIVSTNNFPADTPFVGANISPATKQVSMNWNAAPGEQFSIDISSNLMTWANLTNITIQATNGQFTDPTPIDTQDRRYYRLRRTK